MKVVELGEYIQKVKPDFKGSRLAEAIRKLYDENNVIDKIEIKGRHLFVIK